SNRPAHVSDGITIRRFAARDPTFRENRPKCAKYALQNCDSHCHTPDDYGTILHLSTLSGSDMALQPQEMTWSAYMAVLRRRWRGTAATAGLVALVSIYITFALPAMYESSSLILIEQQEVSPDFVPTTVTSYLDERIQAIHQRVVAAPNVEELIDRLDLYPEERSTVPIDELIALFQDNAKMEPQHIVTVDPRTRRETVINYAFRLSFLHPDPAKARDVVQELPQLYIDQHRALRTEAAARTTAFLDAEARVIQTKLADVAERIAQFHQEHTANLPEDQPVNLQLWTRASEDLTKVE